ncbi:MAG: TetR/AcrR family transcriptional regulator [Bacteroidales bacterium]|nr:TetR/AcrR family transcriptional regulator [Bacteroidales bacterium]
MISEENKRKIVETAIQLFNTKGCKAVTMDDIASAIHISKRTLYETFDSKEALLMECLIEVHKKVGKEKMEIYKKTDEPFLLTLYIIRSTTKHNLRYSRILNDAEQFHPELSQKLLKNFSEFFKSSLQQLFSEAKENGDLREGVDINSTIDLIDLYVRSCSHNRCLNNGDMPKIHGETCYTYLRGLLSLPAIERYDKKEKEFKKLIMINDNQ